MGQVAYFGIFCYYICKPLKCTSKFKEETTLKKSVVALVFALIAILVSSVAMAHDGGVLVVKRVPTAPTIDGSADDSIWNLANRYPLAFNQLNEGDQVWTDLENLNASFRLAYSGNILYGIVYRHDDMTQTGNNDPWENDGVELFFDFTHEVRSVTQIRAIVGRDFAESVGGKKPEAAWSEDGSVFEFAIDLSAAGVEISPGYVMGFNIAINDADTGTRHTQLYPFPGDNTSWNNPNSLGHIIFQ